MPAARPPEFRRRAVELARLKDKPLAQIAQDLGVAESGLRRWMAQADNCMIESFWSTMQRELLDRHDWTTKTELASAMFEWIEGCYNPVRRHTSIGSISPATFESLHTTAAPAA